jgi:hypothetical protein
MQIWRFRIGKSRHPVAETREPVACPVQATSSPGFATASPAPSPDHRMAFIKYLVETGRIHD